MARVVDVKSFDSSIGGSFDDLAAMRPTRPSPRADGHGAPQLAPLPRSRSGRGEALLLDSLLSGLEAAVGALEAYGHDGSGDARARRLELSQDGLTFKEAKALFASVDENGDGTMDQMEFISWWRAATRCRAAAPRLRPRPARASFIWFMDYICDGFFVADFGLNFRTGYLRRDTGALDMDPKRSALYYCRTWAFLDFISSVPPILEILVGNGMTALRSAKILKLGRVMKLGKMFRLAKFMRFSQDTASASSFYGYVVAQATCIVNAYDARKGPYYAKMDRIHSWLNYHQAPLSIRRARRRYYRTYFSHKTAFDEAAILDDLDPESQRMIADHVLPSCIRHNELFEVLPKGALCKLVPVIRLLSFQAGDLVVSEGDKSSSMFIIYTGKVRVRRNLDGSDDAGAGAGAAAAVDFARARLLENMDILSPQTGLAQSSALKPGAIESCAARDGAHPLVADAEAQRARPPSPTTSSPSRASMASVAAAPDALREGLVVELWHARRRYAVTPGSHEHLARYLVVAGRAWCRCVVEDFDGETYTLRYEDGPHAARSRAFAPVAGLRGHAAGVVAGALSCAVFDVEREGRRRASALLLRARRRAAIIALHWRSMKRGLLHRDVRIAVFAALAFCDVLTTADRAANAGAALNSNLRPDFNVRV
ncbi:hypothetical protein SO694_00055039 [Aureococcus anophagefferens]|uniref:Calmodulin n=1 Tax=Aureococcus anophagefferens TaxID=44056 RepID=A0ABR1FXB6_AURAN